MHYLDARHLGFGAGPGQKVSQTTIITPPQMTPSKCQSLCAQHGLPYKGINASGQCSCGKPAVQVIPTPNLGTQLPPPGPSPSAMCHTLCVPYGYTASVSQGQCVCTPSNPPPTFSYKDCATNLVNGAIKLPSAMLPSEFMRRVQAALNYAMPNLPPIPAPNGQFSGQPDLFTAAAWGAFVGRYATWDSGAQKYLSIDPTLINCDGLMLLKNIVDGIFQNQTVFTSPLDDGTPGRTAAYVFPSGTINYEERDNLWLVSPDSRPDLRSALSNLTHGILKTTSGGNIFARALPSSGPIALGHDALTAVRAKIAAGYAAMIATKSDYSQVVICYTKTPKTIAYNCSTKGSLTQALAGGGMNGFGIDTASAGQAKVPGWISTLDPSQATAPQPPDLSTGLPAWALYEGEPPDLIDQARAMFSVTGATPPSPPAPSPSPSPTPTPTPAPGGPPPGYYPPPYPTTAPPAPAPVAAAPTTPSWVKPLAIVGGLGLVAYFAFAE